MPELNEETVIKAIHRMRSLVTDTQRWEVKESVQELPKKLLETISAFSNMHGGTIILGLSEKNGFKPVDDFKVRDSLVRVRGLRALIGERIFNLLNIQTRALLTRVTWQ